MYDAYYEPIITKYLPCIEHSRNRKVLTYFASIQGTSNLAGYVRHIYKIVTKQNGAAYDLSD